MSGSKSNNPKISIVMSVYNGGDFLKLAIESILSQTFTNFEFIIVNDGSTDQSLDVIKLFSDDRIKLISRENKGLVYSLNEAIANSKAKIIARQDADDISEPNRLQKQYDYLSQNQQCVLLGSSMVTIDQFGKVKNIHRVISGNTNLKLELVIRSPFAHGSTMFKKSAFDSAGGYQKEQWPAEDYGLWLRMAQFGKFDNLYEPFYRYREIDTSISSQNSQNQIIQSNKIRVLALKNSDLLPFFGSFEYIEDSALEQRNIENIKSVAKLLLKNYQVISILRIVSIIILSRYVRKNIIVSVGLRIKSWPKNLKRIIR